VAKCRGRTIRDYLIWNPLLPPGQALDSDEKVCDYYT